MSQQVQVKLLDFICQSFMVDLEDIPLDRSLIDEGIIDSFGLMEISAFLETEFPIEIKSDDMTRANFGSVIKIVDFVMRRKGE